MERHCATFKSGCIDFVQRWFNVVSTLDTNTVSMLCNVENPISDFVSFSTLDERYLNDVDQTLTRGWNVCGVVSMKMLILRSILHGNLKGKMKLVGIYQGSC